MASSDAAVLKLISDVEAKIKALPGAARPVYRTNCLYLGQVSQKLNNLHTINDTVSLVLLASDLMIASEYYNKASLLISQEVPPLKISGFTTEEWLHDFKLRADVLKLAEQKKKLATLRKKLDGVMSDDLRRELELEEIKKELEG